MRIYFKRFVSKWLKLFLSIVFILTIIYLFRYHGSRKRSNWIELTGESADKVTLSPFCSCRKSVLIEKHVLFSNVYKKDDYYILFETSKTNTLNDFLAEQPGLDKEKIFVNPRFTCDLDKVFTHGPNKKVLGYAYYGNAGYGKLIEYITNQAKELYPDWIIRVYYDKTIDKSMICDLECRYENIYFCDVNKIPFKYQTGIDFFKAKEDAHLKNLIENDLAHVHGMMWLVDEFCLILNILMI